MTWLEGLVRKALVDIDPYRPGKPVSDVQRELGLKKIVRLCSNENPWPIPEHVHEAINKAALDVARYPDPGAYYLRRSVARKWGVAPTEVIVGAGTEGILYALFQALIDEGDEVVFHSPTYPIYRLAARAAGASCVPVPMTEKINPSSPALLNACSEKTKIVIICNPNNPTGTIFTREDLLNLAGELEKRHILLVVDEAYAEYVADSRYASGVELFRQLGHVAILRTFSKIYGLASLRVGYAIAPKPVVESFAKVRRVFDVNSIAQAAAVASLEESSYAESIREKTILERERLLSELMDMGIKVFPTHTNFLLLEMEDADLVTEHLLHEGVIIRPGSDLGIPGYLRVSVGLPEDNESFILSLRKTMKRLGKR